MDVKAEETLCTIHEDGQVKLALRQSLNLENSPRAGPAPGNCQVAVFICLRRAKECVLTRANSGADISIWGQFLPHQIAA